MANKDEELIDANNASSKFLAQCLAITPQAVSQLASQGVIRNNGRRGKYDLREALPQYVSTLRRSGTAEAKARLAEQQETKLRLANEKEAGKLVNIADAAEVYRAACLAWRGGANALPRRLATQLSNETNPTVIQRLLNEEFANLFANMVEPLRGYFVAAGEPFEVTYAGVPSNGTAAKKNARPMGRRKKNTATRKRGTRKVAK